MQTRRSPCVTLGVSGCPGRATRERDISKATQVPTPDTGSGQAISQRCCKTSRPSDPGRRGLGGGPWERRGCGAGWVPRSCSPIWGGSPVGRAGGSQPPSGSSKSHSWFMEGLEPWVDLKWVWCPVGGAWSVVRGRSRGGHHMSPSCLLTSSLIFPPTLFLQCRVMLPPHKAGPRNLDPLVSFHCVLSRDAPRIETRGRSHSKS